MTVCVGDRHDAVRRSAHSADPRLYVGGLPERNHLLRDSGLEWNCKKGSKRIYVNIIFNLALKIFVYPFFCCLASSFYHCRFGSPLRLRFSSPWVLGSGFCWRYQATTSWTTTVTSKRVFLILHVICIFIKYFVYYGHLNLVHANVYDV